MQTRTKIGIGIAVVVIVLAAFLGKYGLYKGDTFGFGGARDSGRGNRGFVLVDSALLDSDFDGVVGAADRCPNDPPYQVARFGPYDSLSYLGQTVKFVDVDRNGVMSFDVGGKQYGVIYPGATGTNGGTYVPPVAKSSNPGFRIRGLFFNYSPIASGNQAIVVIQRTDYNIDTGCSTARSI